MGLFSIRGLYIFFSLLTGTLSEIICSHEEIKTHFHCLQIQPEIICVDIGLCSFKGFRHVRL